MLMQGVNLLGNSQTLIGVLATIVILCVVTGSGNFLHTILKGVSDPAREKIHRFRDELKSLANSLRGGNSHTKLQNLFSEITNNRQYSSCLKNTSDGYKVMYDISVNEWTNRFNTELVRLDSELDNHIKSVQDSKEQTFAPLYVFGYCIIVFSCDVIVSWIPKLLPFIVSMLAIFTILSIFFLFYMWRKFHAEFCPASKSKTANYISETAIIIHYKKACLTFLCSALLPFATLIVCLWVIDSYIGFIPVIAVRVIIIIGILFPLCLLGEFHIHKRKSLGKHSHSFLLWHFIFIISLSVCCSLILLFLPPAFLYAARIPYSHNLWEIQASVIIFPIFFGMIIPFWVPYHCYVRIDQYAEKNSMSRGII